MLSKRANELIISCTRKEVFAKSARISLTEIPLGMEGAKQVVTIGRYTLKKKPGVPGAKSKKFVINCDLFPGNRLRIKNYKELKELAKTDIRVRFLLNNTNISIGLFNIANEHRDLPLPFVIDWIKYKKNLEKNANGELRKDFLKEASESWQR